MAIPGKQPEPIFIINPASAQVELPLDKKQETVKNVPALVFKEALPQQTQAQRGWLGRAWDGVNYVTYGGASAVAHGAMSILAQGLASALTVGAISESEKEVRIAEARKKMKEALKDPRYLELYDWIAGSFWKFIKPGLLSSVPADFRAIISEKEEFISDLLEIVLAQGFANLAEQAATVKDEQNNHSLANLISLFTQKMKTADTKEGKSFSEALDSIEREYQNSRENVANLAKNFLPQLRMQEQNLIKEYIQLTDPENQKRKEEIKTFLTKEFEKAGHNFGKFFFEECDRLTARHLQLQKVFKEMADKVFVKSLFPKGLEEIGMPSQLRYALNKLEVEKSIAKTIAGYLQEFYDPLVYDSSSTLKKELDKQIGQGGEQVVQASSALALGLSKQCIEGDPKTVVDFLQSTLASFLPSEIVYSQASWIAESLQEILESKNPHFQSLGRFVQTRIHSLVLAVTSQGAKSLIGNEEENKVSPDQLVKVMVDRLIAKINSLSPESKIPLSFWENLGTDLPIPSFLKASILDYINKKVEEWRPTFFEAQTALQDIKKIGESSKQTIQGYKGGKDLIALVEQMSDWLIQKVVKPEGELVTQLGINNEKIEELFQEYFPGIEIRPEFKNWFKNNIGALSANGDQSSQSISLLKQGMTALCLVGIEGALQKNGNGENFIADLLTKFRLAFAEATTQFTAAYSSQMPKILDIQAEIKKNQLRIQELSQQIGERKTKNESYALHTRLTDLQVRQQQRIKEALRAQKRYHRAVDNVENLVESLQQLEEQKRKLYREIQANGVIIQANGVIEGRKQLEAIKTAIANTKSSIKIAERELEISRKNSELKIQEAFQEEAPKRGELGYGRWSAFMTEVFAHLTDLEELHTLTRATAKLEKQLDVYLPPFQALAKKLMGLIGLDQAEFLRLPAFLKNQIWPYMESFQKGGFARLLFKESLPVFEIVQNRRELERISGSPFLGHLAQAISKDLFKLLPDYAGSPEEIIEKIASSMVGFNQGLKEPLIAELQKFIHQDPARYKEETESFQPYLEGLLLKVFIRLAEKNPVQKAQQTGEQDKDTLVVIAEKLLKKTSEKLSAQKGVDRKDSVAFAKELSGAMMQEVLGIDSSQFFEDLGPLKGLVYDFVKGQLESNLIDIQEGLKTLEKAPTVKRPVDRIAEKLAEDLAHFIVDATVDNLGKKSTNGDLSVVDMISANVKTQVELAKGKLSVAKVLQDYQGAPQLKEMLGKTVGPLLDPQQFVQDRVKLIELLSNLLERLLNGAVGTIGHFEDDHKAKFNQSLMTNLLHAAAEHFKNIRAAKEIAKEAGHIDIHHQDFHQASRGYPETLARIQAAFAPTSLSEEVLAEVRLELTGLVDEELTVDKIIQMVCKGYHNIHHIRLDVDADQRGKLEARNDEGLTLLEVIKEEALPNLREASAYTPAVKAVLDLLLPNGKQDLTFIPENQRTMVYGLLKTTLFPMILQIITDVILNPDMINGLVLNSLQVGVETFKAPLAPLPKKAPPSPAPNPELNQAAGELLEQILPMLALPKALKDQILDSKGHVAPSMKEALGSVLVGQLTDSFIRDKLQMVLEMAVLKQLFNYHAQPGTKVTEQDLKKVTREFVSEGLSYTIRSQWAQAQARWDHWIEEYFGKVGIAVKSALDAVFSFVFFKVIGTILQYAFYPVTLLVKEVIYKAINLDMNRKIILDPLTKKPVDQPQADYVVYNEDLMVRLCKALEEALEEAD